MLALRLAACKAVHEKAEKPFLLVNPKLQSVRSYLTHVGLIDRQLKDDGGDSSSEILLPITRIPRASEVEAVGERLHRALCDLPPPLAGASELLMCAFSELCDNAVTHGRNPYGTFLLAQRNGSTRLSLTVGDLGVGIPRHLVDALPDLAAIHEARRIVKALQPGVSGASGRRPRGSGLPRIIETIREAPLPNGELRIWSDTGRVLVGGDTQNPRGRIVNAQTRGTWTEVLFSTAPSRR
jgi:signal transduction histidine kinase